MEPSRQALDQPTGPRRSDALVPHEGRSAVLEVEHVTRYDYSQPVSMAQHLAILEPMSDERQALLEFDLEIDPSADPQASHARRDACGNRLRWFSISRPHEHLTVTARSRVEVWAWPDVGPWHTPDQSPRCADVAASLRYHPSRAWQSAVEFLQPSPYVPRLPALREFAEPALHPDKPVLQAAVDLMRAVHRDFTYRSRSTDVNTPLQRVLEQRQGVCQDFAHLLIGMLRMAGLPARYVSGYLLTAPAPGQPQLVGADASHAWVQVWCPGGPDHPAGHWIDLDPTNDLMPELAHVRVATGRDFGDVTPLRGVIRGGGSHRLSVGVTTRLAEPETV